MNIHSSTIQSSQRWKQTKCLPTDQWVNKIERTYNEILFSHTKHRSTDTCCNRNEPWIHYIGWKKWDHVWRDSTTWNAQNRHVYRARGQISDCLELEGWGNWEVAAKGSRVLFGLVKCSKIGCRVAARLCEHTKMWTYRVAPFKWAIFPTSSVPVCKIQSHVSNSVLWELKIMHERVRGAVDICDALVVRATTVTDTEFRFVANRRWPGVEKKKES